MKHPFKSISVYFDRDYNLIGVPSAELKKWNVIVDIDKIQSLNAPYDDDELERFLKAVFDLCNSDKPKDFSKIPALQKYLGAKSYSASVKKLGLVSLNWLNKRGYEIVPTWQNAKIKNAFNHLEEKTIKIATDYTDGELAKSFRIALELSPIGPMKNKPD